MESIHVDLNAVPHSWILLVAFGGPYATDV